MEDLELLTKPFGRMNRGAINRGRADTDRFCVARGNVTLLPLALWTLSSCVVGQGKASEASRVGHRVLTRPADGIRHDTLIIQRQVDVLKRKLSQR